MTDLTKIEKPYALCTKEEQEGLKALVGIEGALQRLSDSGHWKLRHAFIPNELAASITYRQNPDWQPPKLDVPDWFWENTDYNYVAMDQNGKVWAFKHKPAQDRIDRLFKLHDFNPHNVPWDQSLTKRPEE